MRIGIITFHFVWNHGAALQAYAMCKALQGMGHDALVIDYRPWSLRAYRPWSLVSYLKPTLWRSLPSAARMRLAYRSFGRRYVPQTPRRYFWASHLMADAPRFDAYICGSDQIWNVHLHRFDPAYYLSFAPKASSRLIAYAPSFGNFDPLASEFRDDIAGLISRIDCLSAREEEGRAFIRDLTGRECPLVLDPTLLADYDAVTARPRRAGEYIAAYPMDMSDEFVGLVEAASRALGLPVLLLKNQRSPLKCSRLADLGPSEWLGYVRQARFVCTNSFHGTVFAVLFHKAFLTCRNTFDNTRMDTFLKLTNLSGRQVERPDLLCPGDSRFEDICYDEADSLLNAARSRSLDYLRLALGAEVRNDGRAATS